MNNPSWFSPTCDEGTAHSVEPHTLWIELQTYERPRPQYYCAGVIKLHFIQSEPKHLLLKLFLVSRKAFKRFQFLMVTWCFFYLHMMYLKSSQHFKNKVTGLLLYIKSNQNRKKKSDSLFRCKEVRKKRNILYSQHPDLMLPTLSHLHWSSMKSLGLCALSKLLRVWICGIHFIKLAHFSVNIKKLSLLEKLLGIPDSLIARRLT